MGPRFDIYIFVVLMFLTVITTSVMSFIDIVSRMYKRWLYGGQYAYQQIVPPGMRKYPESEFFGGHLTRKVPSGRMYKM